MRADPGTELVAHFYAAADEAARRRAWSEVADLVEDVLVLDPHHGGALALKRLAERYVEPGGQEWGRRHETVLFADLVGSTALANRFDPEFVRGLIRSYELACTPVLSTFGGHVHRFVGDGILASFGYPTAHEDDARRAVQAALDLVKAVEATSAQYQPIGAPLQVRVGVASGVVVHGDRGTGSSTEKADLFGPPVNLAARLHEVAPPGGVCISAETAALVEGFFVLEPMGAHRLKGYDLPIPIHRVVRPTGATGWVDRHGPPAARFVGREAELGVLRANLGRIAEGSTAAVLITGEPGVGKSRLSRELIAAADSTARVVELQCSAYRTTSPLFPVRTGIERSIGIEPDDDDANRLAKLRAAVGDHEALVFLAMLLEIDFGETLTHPELSPVQLREATLGHLFDWVKAVSERGPVILLIEDLHWADPTTCTLLERIVTARLAGLFTVVTSRTPDDRLLDVGVDRLQLDPLSRDDVRTLARDVGGEGLPSELIEEIAARSDGIPLFVEQLANSLKLDDGAAGDRTSIPRNLTELLQARVDATGSSKRVVQLAAVIGRDFDPDLVAELARELHDNGKFEGLDRTVGEHLDRLRHGRLIEPDVDDAHQLRFHHALVTQTAYESQLLDERLDRHRALAQVLLRGGTTGRAADPAVVAFHFDQARCHVEAVTQYFAAAASAQAMGALAEVMAHLTRADELLAHVDDGVRPPLELALRLLRGQAAQASSGYGAPTAIEDFGASAVLCEQLKDVPGMGNNVLQALLGLWCVYYSTGELVKSEGITAAMEEHLETATLPAGRPSYHACRGVELFCKGELPLAKEHFQIAIELFSDDDVDPHQWTLPNDPLGAVYAFLGPLHLFSGDEAAALAAAEAGVARCADLEFPRGPFTVAFIRTYEAWMHRERGAIDAAIAAADEVLHLGERHGFFDWITAGRLQRAAATLAVEPSGAVLDELGHAIQAFRVNGEEWILSSLLIDRGWGYLVLGEFDQVERCLTEADVVFGHGQLTSLAEAHRLRAELLAHRDGPEHPAIADELRAGMRFAAGQEAPLFVLRCGASYERWLGAAALDRLDGELVQAYRIALAMFGADSPTRERFLRTCGPSPSVIRAGA